MVEVDHATHADLIDSTELASPLPVHERIPAPDVLRSVAVAGILLGWRMSPDKLAALVEAR